MRLIGSARRRAYGRVAATGIAVALAAAAGPAAGAVTLVPVAGRSAAGVRYSVGPIRDASAGCPGTGDISEAVDRARGYVYQEFEGCDHGDGIGFARSANGGRSYTAAVALPRSGGGWDPSLAVAPDGTLYAAFMKTAGHRTYPRIEVSRNHGMTSERVTPHAAAPARNPPAVSGRSCRPGRDGT